MNRLLGLLLIGVALWMFLEIGWARLKRAVGAGNTHSLVRCSGCGVHVPQDQMVGGRCERCRLP